MNQRHETLNKDFDEIKRRLGDFNVGDSFCLLIKHPNFLTLISTITASFMLFMVKLFKGIFAPFFIAFYLSCFFFATTEMCKRVNSVAKATIGPPLEYISRTTKTYIVFIDMDNIQDRLILAL